MEPQSSEQTQPLVLKQALPKKLILLIIPVILLLVGIFISDYYFLSPKASSNCFVTWAGIPNSLDSNTQYTIYISKVSTTDKWRDVSVFKDVEADIKAPRENGLTGDAWDSPSNVYKLEFDSGDVGVHKLYFYNNDFKSYGESSGTGPRTLCDPVLTYVVNNNNASGIGSQDNNLIVGNDFSSETSTPSADFILYQNSQAPTGETVYQTEIPSDWTAYTTYFDHDIYGKDYPIGRGYYVTRIGPSHFYQGPSDVTDITNGMVSSILIEYSASASAIEQKANESVGLNNKQIVVDGVDASQFSLPDQGGMSTNVIFTKNNTTYLIIEPNGSGNGSDMFKHLLSTFKSIKGQLY